jgi:hypothetical protein
MQVFHLLPRKFTISTRGVHHCTVSITSVSVTVSLTRNKLNQIAALQNTFSRGPPRPKWRNRRNNTVKDNKPSGKHVCGIYLLRTSPPSSGGEHAEPCSQYTHIITTTVSGPRRFPPLQCLLLFCSWAKHLTAVPCLP